VQRHAPQALARPDRDREAQAEREGERQQRRPQRAGAGERRRGEHRRQDVAAAQQHGPHRQGHGRRHAFVRVFEETGPGLAEAPVHPDARQAGAVHEVGAGPGGAQPAHQRQRVVDPLLDGRVPARGEVGPPLDQEQLAAGGAEARLRGRPHPADRQVAKQQEADHRHGQQLADRARLLARHAAHERHAGIAGVADQRRRRVRLQAHVGVDEQQVRTPRGLREALAGVVLARPSRGAAAAPLQPHARVHRGVGAHDLGGAVGRVVVHDHDLDRHAPASPRRRERVADVDGLVAGRDQDRDQSLRWSGRSRLGAASARRLAAPRPAGRAASASAT
jgi:hypothetical protein